MNDNEIKDFLKDILYHGALLYSNHLQFKTTRDQYEQSIDNGAKNDLVWYKIVFNGKKFNIETLEAMVELELGQGTKSDSVEQLLLDLKGGSTDENASGS